MRRAVRRAGVGRFDLLLLERHLPEDLPRPSGSARLASPEDLARLAVLGLAPAASDWLRAGSLAVWLPDEHGEPAAILWWHLHAHVDRYLGAWSRPAPGTAYENAVATRPDVRGLGLGGRLMAEAAFLAHERGVRIARAAVEPGNEPSVRLHHRAGYTTVGRLSGLRLGPATARLRRRVRS